VTKVLTFAHAGMQSENLVDPADVTAFNTPALCASTLLPGGRRAYEEAAVLASTVGAPALLDPPHGLTQARRTGFVE
jgi:hypothetical protein